MHRYAHTIFTTLPALAIWLTASSAFAQAFPSKPIKMLVPYSAGGGTDFFARNVAQKMSEQLGRPVIVENKPGASTIIAAQELMRSTPDGYTVLLGDTTTYAVNPTLQKKLPYDPMKDFAPVSLTARFVMTLAVNPSVLKANSVKELIEAAKKDPGGITYGTPGTGTPHHLAMEAFQQAAGIKLTHVPYKGAAPALQDLVGGQIPLMFLDLPSAQPQLKGGKIKFIATATPKPVPSLPGVPTISESGFPGFEAWAWQGFVVPAGTPPDVIAKLRDAYMKAINDPALRQKLVDAGLDPMQSTPQEMSDYTKSEITKWAKVIKAGNITLD